MFLSSTRKILVFSAGLGCVAAAWVPQVLARADWLRKRASAQEVERAIRLEPGHPYGYTLRAELFEHSGQLAEAEKAWRDSLRINPRDAEAWMRTAVLAERRGDAAESERCFLRAAEASSTWLPRWALVNFYARQGRQADVWKWSRLAFERASMDDVDGLFAVLEAEGAASGFVLRELLPPGDPRLAGALVRRIAAKGPQSVGEGSGTVLEAASRCGKGERDLLLNAVDWLLDGGQGETAVRLWDVLRARKIVEGEGWSAERPVLNSRFERTPLGAGLDWRLAKGEGVEIAMGGRELRVELNGKQPESVDLVLQRLVLPRGAGSYRVEAEGEMEGLKEGCGLEWVVRDGWLVLRYRRPMGQVRAEGVARFRGVRIVGQGG